MKRLIALSWMLMAGQAAAQTYPAKIIRVINPAAAGGNRDLLFRTLAPRMTEGLGQQLVMDYRPGAGATVGTLHLCARKSASGSRWHARPVSPPSKLTPGIFIITNCFY